MRASNRSVVRAAVMDNNFLIECRYVADDTRDSPGRLTGVLLTYGERARDRPEVWLPGSASWPDAGFIINTQHDRKQPIVRAIPFVDGNVVRIDAKLPNNTAGRDAAENVKEGILTGLSVEFRRPVARMVAGVREIRQAFIEAAGLVDLASFPGSAVEIRHAGRALRPSGLTGWL